MRNSEKQNTQRKVKGNENKTTNINTMSKETTTAAAPASETAAPKKAGGKLPENLFYKNKAGEVLTKPAEDIIGSLVKMFGVKDIGEKKATDVVKTVLLLNFKAAPEQAELPAGLEDADKFVDKNGNSLPDAVHSFVQKHIECKKELEEQKNTEKEAKAQEREAAKLAKAEEDKKYAAEGEEFGEMLAANVAKLKKTAGKLVENLVGALKLPDNISLAAGSMGINVADGATKADIASAAAAVLSVYEGVKSAEGAMQFLVGDLVNASVKSGTFRTQNDAATGLKHIIQEKCQKKYEIGTIQQYAMMAARIPASERKMGIKPSLYLAAAKVTPPRIKDAQPADMEKANEEVEAFRNDLLKDINSGKVNTSEIAETVKLFKEQRGWSKPVENNTAEILKAFKVLFFVDWLTENVANKKDEVIVTRGKESHSYTVAELAEKKAEAFEYLTQELLKEEDIEMLIKGERPLQRNGKQVTVPYRLSDPFFVKSKETATEEPEQVPVEEVKTEEATEETESEEEETEEEGDSEVSF
jgi:hypothetical protein